MSDLYKEILVKPAKKSSDVLKKGLWILLTAFCFLAGMFVNQWGMLAFIVMIFLDIYLIFPRMNVEYEYLYVNGDFDVDKIFNKSSRKRVGSYNSGDLQIMAPTGSDQLKSCMNGKNVKIRDFSGDDPKEKSWTLIYGDADSQEALILELPDEVAQDMRRHSPRKVFFQ